MHSKNDACGVVGCSLVNCTIICGAALRIANALRYRYIRVPLLTNHRTRLLQVSGHAMKLTTKATTPRTDFAPGYGEDPFMRSVCITYAVCKCVTFSTFNALNIFVVVQR